MTFQEIEKDISKIQELSKKQLKDLKRSCYQELIGWEGDRGHETTEYKRYKMILERLDFERELRRKDFSNKISIAALIIATISILFSILTWFLS